MSDKELLVLAAKAAGFTLDDAICTDEWLVIYSKVQDPLFGEPEALYWNPLTDDSDALHLAVDLGFQVDVINCNGITCVRNGVTQSAVNATEKHNGDCYAATRRAIVRAAAEIGKAMP